MKATDGYEAHPSACIDEGVEIGQGTKIWHFSHIMSGAKIGEHCTIGQNVFIAANVKIGNRVKIQNNVSIYEGVILEDGVFCGPSMVFTNVRTPRALYSRKGGQRYIPTRVKKGASIGANATIVCGVILGEFAMVGAGAVVTKDVSPYAIVTGVPSQRVGWACMCGEILQFKDSFSTCSFCKKQYVQTKEEQVFPIEGERR